MHELIRRYRERLTRTTRASAFLTHAAVSAAVVAIVCACIFALWYPAPYFRISRAWDVLKVLIGVDLILGPALTLLVFKPAKPSLLFDLAVIVGLQLAALIYGTTTIYQQRPYYVVFAVDRFEVLARADVNPAGITDPDLQHKPWRKPLLVAALFPDDPVLAQRLLEETVFEGRPDIHLRPEFWHPLRSHSDLVAGRAESRDAFRQRHPAAAAAIDALERRYPDRALGLLPVMRGMRAATVVIDLATGRPLDALAVDFWTGATPRSTAQSAP